MANGCQITLHGRSDNHVEPNSSPRKSVKSGHRRFVSMRVIISYMSEEVI
nr:MAG TPA: hypothetical protein [Caudoviricetes sp.]